MKWAYVPIMFTLAFAYTKFSFYDFGNKVSAASGFSTGATRGPASMEEQKPKLTELKRVQASALYKNLNDTTFSDVFHKISIFRGTVVGNPHVESFGFVIDDKSKATFSLRDFPDASEGVYLHDVLAHLVSAKTIEKKISWIHYYEAYKSGLQDQPHIFSYYIEKGLDDAIWAAQKNFEENVTQDTPFEFTKLKKTHQRVSAVKKSLIQEALKKKFPKVQFFDLFESIDMNKNYHVLIRVRPQDKIQWIELDESSLCDYDQAFNQDTKAISFDRRFEILKADIFDGKLNSSLDTVTIDKKHYVLKFSDHFSATLALSEIPSDDYLDIILDEAYVLGRIHRRSLGERADDYIKSWATIPGAVVDEKMVELKYRLKDLHE